MDRDRELARLIREAGLVPVERVRESLRRVGMLRSKGHDTDLLRELVRTGQLDVDGAQRVEQMWRAELESSDSVKLVRLRAHEKRRRSPESDGTLPQAGGVRLSEAERSLLHEQARIVDLAKLVSRDDLRAAYLEVAQQRLRGMETDLLTRLEENGQISPAHARAVRAKIQLDKQRPSREQAPSADEPGEDPRQKDAAASSRRRKAVAHSSLQSPSPPQARKTPPQTPPAPQQPADATRTHASPETTSAVNLPLSPAGAHSPQDSAVSVQDQSFPDLAVVGFDGTAPVASVAAPRAPAEKTQSESGDGSGKAPAASAGGRASSEKPRGLQASRGAQGRPASPAEALRHRDRALARILVERLQRLNEPQLASLERRMDAARRRGRRTDLAQELLNAGLMSWEDLEPLLNELPRVPGDMSGEERLAEAHAATERTSGGSGKSGGAASTPASSGSRRINPLGGGPLPGSRGEGGSSRVRRVPAGESADMHEPPPVALPRQGAAAPGKPGKQPEPPAAADSTGVALPPERLVTYIPQVKLPRSQPTGAGRHAGSAKRRAKRPTRRTPRQPPRMQESPRFDEAAPAALPHPPAGARTHGTYEADPEDAEPLGALEGDVGEDRLSVRRALGLGSGVHLREEPEAGVEEWGESEIGAAGQPTSPTEAEPGPLAGRRSKYKLLNKIAKGGMGSVVRVEDCDIRRVVAMKRLENWRDREAMERFIEEAQVTGQLEHPNIVPVHDIGLDPQGRLFFTMKFVHGESLAQILEQIRRRSRNNKNKTKGTREVTYRGFNLARLLQVFLKVCDAISFAHAKGVIHRDLKPENVMVGAFGEVLVMDWGVAKLIEPKAPEKEVPADSRERVKRRRSSGRLPRMGGLVQTGSAGTEYDHHATSKSGRVRSSRAENSSLQSQTGDIVGTAMYMSPEQARGEVGSLDERTDVYALGAMLYEILTLEPPFDGHNVFMILRAVLDEEVVPPRTRAPERQIPADLEHIVLRAMEKNRADRYPSAEALKADLLNYVEGRMIEAASYTSMQRISHWLRRPAKLAALAAALLLVGAATWVVLTHPALFGESGATDAQHVEALESLEQRLHRMESRAHDARAAKRHARIQETRLRHAWLNDLRQQLDRYVAAGELHKAQATVSRWQRLVQREKDPALALARANVFRLRAGGAVKAFDVSVLPRGAWRMRWAVVPAEPRAGDAVQGESPAVLLVRAQGRDLYAYHAATGERLLRLERLPSRVRHLLPDPNVRGRLEAYDQHGRVHRLELSPVADALRVESAQR